MRPLVAVLAFAFLAGCASETDPLTPPERPLEHDEVRLDARADSVANRLVQASGGLSAWERLPALGFSFGFERDGERSVLARHLWDRRRNRYRVEWAAPGAPDSVYVALFSDWPEEGVVYLNGEPVEAVGTNPALAAAQRRTINDTYWLLAPLKVFDPGVTRTYAPDSSDALFDVIRLSFDDVGLTPGDQYWLFVDRETGLLDRWTFLLQNADAARTHDWGGYEQVGADRRALTLATRKEPHGGGAVILTDDLTAEAPDRAAFTDPNPRWLNR